MDTGIKSTSTEAELDELWRSGSKTYTEALRILEHQNCSSGTAVSIITNMPDFDGDEESGVGNYEYGVLFSRGLEHSFTTAELETISGFLNDLVADCYDSITEGSFPNDLMDILHYDLPGDVARLEGHSIKSCRALIEMVESFLNALEECPPDERLADLDWAEEIFNLAATVFINSATDIDIVQKLSKRVQEFQENSN